MGIAFMQCRRIGVPPARIPLFMLFLAVGLGGLAWPAEARARQNSVSADLAVGLDYDSNIFKSDLHRENEWKSLVAPQLSLDSKGAVDNLSLTYAPQFAYNHRREEDEIAHNLSLLADKRLSSRWQVLLSGNYASSDQLYFEPLVGLGALGTTRNFLRADAATQAEVVRLLFPELAWNPTVDISSVISQLQQRYDAVSAFQQSRIFDLLTQGADGARQRYWTSMLQMSSAYEFASKSFLTLGYRFANQDNQTGVMADHLEQAPSLLATYQFTPQWRGEVGYELIATSYDSEEESTANSSHLQLDYQISPAHLLFWNYSHKQIIFSGRSGDTTNQDGHATWRYGPNKQTALTTTLGASYLDRELSADERAYSLNLGLSRSLEWGTIALSGNGVTAKANPADSWDKSRQSWEVTSTVDYRLRRNLSALGSFSYGQWDTWSVGRADHYDRLRLTAGLHYEFQRGFTLSLHYEYNRFTAASIFLDDYTNHLITLRLTTKELWRW